MTLSHFIKQATFMLILMIYPYISAYSCPAATEAKEEELPKIITLSIQGIGEFAEKFEAYLESYPNSLLLTDFDGVVTRHSDPLPHNVVYPRGDMPAYLAYLHEVHKTSLILSSAWDKPKETFQRITRLNLCDTFDLQKPVIKGEEKLKDNLYSYIRKGNAISARLDDLLNEDPYFRQKALAPLIIFGDSFCYDQLVFIDDSPYNHEIFMQDIVMLPFYSKLKQIVLFELTEIMGEILEGDNIDEKYLPVSYKEKWAASTQAVGSHSTTTMSVEKEDLALQRSSRAWRLEEKENVSLNSLNDRIVVGETS